MYGELCNLIPKRYAKYSPADRHQFSILSPEDGGSSTNVGICCVSDGGQEMKIAIRASVEPIAANAICQLARLPRNGYRPAKYLDLFKIAESLGVATSPEQSALRHALAHSTDVISRPSTVTQLVNLFGSVKVDLENEAHVRTFWRLFGELLVKVDCNLARRLRIRTFTKPGQACIIVL